LGGTKASQYVDPSQLRLSDGVTLVRLARRAVEEYLRSGKVPELPEVEERLLAKGMTFTTIRKILGGNLVLRGCIGYLVPIEPLVRNVVTTALAAAFEDPRFEPVSLEELNHLIFEVSVLSVPQDIKARGRERAREVRVGQDGLVVEYRVYKGVLLPEVPVEYCWDAETFLSETCIKAGLDPDCWLSDRVRVKKFVARVFRELTPGGEVTEVNLVEEYSRRCL